MCKGDCDTYIDNRRGVYLGPIRGCCVNHRGRVEGRFYNMKPEKHCVSFCVDGCKYKLYTSK